MNPLYIANEGRRVATLESMDLKDRRSSLLEALIHVRSALVILRVITKYLIECFEIPEKVFYKTRTAKKQIFKYSNIRPVAMKMK